MKHYLLSIQQPDGDPPPPEILDPIMAELGKLNEEMRAAGAWVFALGLHPASTATVLRDQVMTDGPFAEGKEHLGCFTVINAPDLDAALEWAEKGARACANPVEVRPFQPIPEGS